MQKDPEMQDILAQIDDLYDASAQLPQGNEHWAERSRMQVEIIQLCRELADMHDDAPLPYWMEKAPESEPKQAIDEVAQAATVPMHAWTNDKAANEPSPTSTPPAADEDAQALFAFIDSLSNTSDDALAETARWYADTAQQANVTDATAIMEGLLDGPMLPASSSQPPAQA